MKIFFAVFIAVSVLHILFIFLNKEMLRRISKALIIPPLLAAYIAGADNILFFVIPALVLGWMGDVLLIWLRKKIFFILGLVSFLLGHLCYIIVFCQIIGFSGFDSIAANINIPAMAIFAPQVLILGIVVFRLVKPAKEVLIPVIFYMAVLVTMGLFGFQTFLFRPDLGGLLILSGCFNFMVSDTMLAYYMFRKLKLSGAVLIMLFYIMAQAEIIMGLMI